jgi:hypothetical protein
MTFNRTNQPVFTVYHITYYKRAENGIIVKRKPGNDGITKK